MKSLLPQNLIGVILKDPGPPSYSPGFIGRSHPVERILAILLAIKVSHEMRSNVLVPLLESLVMETFEGFGLIQPGLAAPVEVLRIGVIRTRLMLGDLLIHWLMLVPLLEMI